MYFCRESRSRMDASLAGMHVAQRARDGETRSPLPATRGSFCLCDVPGIIKNKITTPRKCLHHRGSSLVSETDEHQPKRPTHVHHHHTAETPGLSLSDVIRRGRRYSSSRLLMSLPPIVAVARPPRPRHGRSPGFCTSPGVLSGQTCAFPDYC